MLSSIQLDFTFKFLRLCFQKHRRFLIFNVYFWATNTENIQQERTSGGIGSFLFAKGVMTLDFKNNYLLIR